MSARNGSDSWRVSGSLSSVPPKLASARQLGWPSMIIRVVASPLSFMGSAARSSPIARATQHAEDDIAVEDADGLVADDAGAGDIVELDAPAVRRDDDEAARCGRSALMLSSRGRNFGGVLGGGVSRALHLDLHQIGLRFAHRDAAHQQRPEIHARRAFFHADVA